MTSTESRKGGKKAEVPLKVQQTESFHSLNHLYQAAVHSAIRSSVQKTSLGDSIQKVIQFQSLARKATLRVDTSISRSLCQICHVPLLPGLTSSIRCRTFLPTSRAMQVCCRFCNSSRRYIAPPSRQENGHSLAIRNRRKAARKVEYKLASHHQVEVAPLSTDNSATSSSDIVKEPTKQRKWSQRARRRAGKLKAQMLQARIEDVVDANPLQKEEDTSCSKMMKLPRYANRIKAQSDSWDSKLKTSEISNHERQAVKLLRGDHLLTSGIGRGGFVGPIEVASPSNNV